ncbi:MAG: cupredoxin domain-containing protein [Acidimicrobiales bacterium]
MAVAASTGMVTTRLSPLVSRSRRSARHAVIVQNHGDAPAHVALEAVDDSGGLVLALSAPEVAVAPGEQEEVALSVRARRRSFGRRVRAHEFHVGAARAVYFQDPVRWRRPALVAALIGVIGIGFGFVASARTGGPVTTERSSGGVLTSAAAASAPACGDANEIVIASFAYCPAATTVAAGTEVTWVNHDDVPHTVTIEAADSGPLERGESFSRRFDKPGTYGYYCRFHPNMRATVVVT